MTSASVSRGEDGALSARRSLERQVVLDDAVDDDVDAVGRVEVRVRVLLVDAAVRGPAGVADAGRGRALGQATAVPVASARASTASRRCSRLPTARTDSIASPVDERDARPSRSRGTRGLRQALPGGAPATGRRPTYPTMPHMRPTVASGLRRRRARLRSASAPAQPATREACSTAATSARRRRPRPRPRSAPRPSRARAARCRWGARARARGPPSAPCSRRRRPARRPSPIARVAVARRAR